MTEPLLRVEGLRVAYGRITAVRDVSFQIAEGEFVGLIGANGAGKSSTLNAIAGIVPVAAGKVMFAGSSIRGEAAERIVRRGVSLVPEGRQVFTRLTTEENLRLAAGTTGNHDAGAVARIYERFPVLERYRKTPAGRLSGGEQQQLVIGRALLTRPTLLMLDEPSLGLAPKLVDDVFSILGDLREEGTTVFLVEQNPAKTIAAVDRTLVMTHGAVESLASHDELQTRENLVAVYLGRQRKKSG